jgi:hypothetical protein
VVLAPLGVADDGVAHAELLQHGRRHLAGEGALLVLRDVLRAEFQRRAVAQHLHLREVRRRHAHGDGARGALHAGDDGAHQRVVGLDAAVHLPVAGDQLLLRHCS